MHSNDGKTSAPTADLQGHEALPKSSIGSHMSEDPQGKMQQMLKDLVPLALPHPTVHVGLCSVLWEQCDEDPDAIARRVGCYVVC